MAQARVRAYVFIFGRWRGHHKSHHGNKRQLNRRVTTEPTTGYPARANGYHDAAATARVVHTLYCWNYNQLAGSIGRPPIVPAQPGVVRAQVRERVAAGDLVPLPP